MPIGKREICYLIAWSLALQGHRKEQNRREMFHDRADNRLIY
jgi:hypothetical protein